MSLVLSRLFPFTGPTTVVLAYGTSRISKGVPARGPISSMAGQQRGWKIGPRSGRRGLATPTLACEQNVTSPDWATGNPGPRWLPAFPFSFPLSSLLSNPS
ncbi:uncharacterized protein BO80DRAFT_14776 [Aspergillus ibericus CBS 121593]|uniref:Uncharacterized protein n=1 Tax=Aspergillus ibericus CBS 121593 TaxID=1448316 RepID=A0A395H5L4_9EURO|nr:hypothetical protein BO80DRAFT_14776 [Aspergillus ibericus CBS 121593]RAL03172.1 hypothetical protein BO80DRAFT_14776 [Aspergillus ibericus CBS 121593]